MNAEKKVLVPLCTISGRFCFYTQELHFLSTGLMLKPNALLPRCTMNSKQ